MKRFSFLSLLFLLIPVIVTAQQKTENLAFKILEQKAAAYEKQLTESLQTSLARYIPSSRFHLSARIYWNPDQIDKIKLKNEPLKKKENKLPGFPIYIREEVKTLDYYMGSGSVMRLRINVLLDENLPESYELFVKRFIPIQARFVAERGDHMVLSRIRFPEARDDAMPDKQLEPLVMDDATSSLISSLEKHHQDRANMEPVMIHPLLQRYISEYENHITEKLSAIINKYVDEKDFLTNVKFFWNPNELSQLQHLIVRTDPQGKVKLPGFTIFLEERDSIYEAISNSTRLMRMEVSVLLNKKVPKETEPFLKKAVPLSVKFMPERGDKLKVERGLFPTKKKPESTKQSIMEGPVANADQQDEVPQEEMGTEDDMNQGMQAGAQTPKAAQPFNSKDPVQVRSRNINSAFEQGNYRKGIELVNNALLAAKSEREKVSLMKMKGSLHFMLQEKEQAMLSWENVLASRPNDVEAQEILNYLKNESDNL